MSNISFNQSSILSSGDQTFALNSLVSVPGDAAKPAVLVLRAYDRDVYSGTQSYDYGNFSSPAGGTVSAGTQTQATLLYFDLKNGVYVSRASGEPLSAFNFTSSDQNHRSVYLSLFTNDNSGATYDSLWMDPSWHHISDLNVVTRTDYVDATPNLATPAEIAAIAKSFIGQVWSDVGCWLLTSNISAAAGASLPVASGRLDTAALSGNGQWQVVFDGAHQNEDWRAMLQVGDIVELGWLNGKAHIATVTSGSGHNALWVDNSGNRADDGTPSDIVIQGEHSVDSWTSAAVDSSVVVFRLGTSTAPAATLPTPIAPPVVTGHPQSLHVGQSLSVASLFSVLDPNLLPMTSYQITDLNGSANIALNGAHNLASAAQQAGGTVIVSAADLTRLSYTAALGPDALTITAFNGQAWGTAKVTVTGWIDPPPVVTGASLAVHASSQLLPVASLFSATAGAGHFITEYRFIDSDHTGQLGLSDLRVNLASNDEAALGIVRVSAANLNTVAWKALAETGTLQVSAFDGVQWSDFVAVTVAGQNNAPTVTPAPRVNVSINQAVPVASMFSLSDADHDAVTMVSIYDFYDHIQLNGATDYCPFPHAYQVKLDELYKVTYNTPDVMGGLQGLQVNAYDGTSWSALTQILFTIDDPAPVVQSGSSAQASPNQLLPFSQLFSVVDPYGKAITQYSVQDPSGGGSVQLGGATDLASAAQHAQGIVVVAAGDLARLSYQASSQVSSEALLISAFNGSVWGSAHIAVSTADSASPSVFAPASTLDLARTVPLGSLFTAYAPSGKPLTQYLIHDPSGGGTLLLGGAHDLATAAQHAQGDVVFAASELGLVKYLTASSAGDETLGVSAFDGSAWGQGDVLVTSKNYGRPVVTAVNATVHSGQSVSLQDLFKVSDADGLPIAGYQVNDSEHHLQLNGADNYYAADQYKGFYGFLPGDLAKVAYVAGAPGTYTIYVEAGIKTGASSMGEAVTITVLSNPVITPTTVTVAIHQSVALTDLFSAANPSGKALLEYKIEQPAGAGTLYLNGAVNLATAAEQAQGVSIVSAADLGKLHYTGAGAFSVDNLTISAWDGISWGASPVPVTTIDGTPPQVAQLATSVEADTTVALASLFSATAHSGLPVTLYKIVNPNGGGKLVLNGAANAATPAQQAQEGMAIIAASDLDKVQYVGADTPGSETLVISAFDGQSWGTAYLPIASVKSAPPLVTPATAFLEPGQPVALSSLFSVSDPDGRPISYYIFQDSSNNIALNGASNLWAQQQSAGYYWIGAADFGKLTYAPSADGVFRYNVIVNDGHNFSTWSSGLAVVGKERLSLPPSLTPALDSVALGQKVALSSLFVVHDPLDKAIVQYSVHDAPGGGQIVLNGATDLATAAQHAQGIVVFSAADLAKVQYQGAASGGAESLAIGADDGLAWGTADIAVTSAVLPPVIHAGATSIEINQLRDASALFSVTDSSGAPITQYKFQDPSGGGRILLDGAANLASAAQQAQGISIVSALDLEHVHYSSGAVAGSETLLIGAFDGKSWGAANLAVASSDNRAPLIVQGARTVDLNTPVALDTLFKGSSVSGKAIVEYLISDPSGGGQVLLNSAHDLASAAQKSAGITVVAAYDLGNLLYTGAAGVGGESLQVTAFDGQNSSSASVHIDSVQAALPVVTPKPIAIHVGDSVKLSDLDTIVDPNGHAIKYYFVMDFSLGIELNGAANIAVSPYYDYHGHYDFNNAADWGKISYVGQAPGTVHLVVQVDDGYNVSNYVEQVITVVARGEALPVATVTKVAGGGAQDKIYPVDVSNKIDAGAGIDTVAYLGNRADYNISANADGSFSVIDNVTNGARSNDTLVNVERLEFRDARIALDIGVNGTGPADAGQVFSLYQAAFNRVPDQSGLGFWIAQADAGTPLGSIAAALTSSGEFRNLYGGLTDHQFVEQLYQNVLHRTGDEAGLAFWESMIDGHHLSAEQILVNFAESAENQAALVGLVQHGIAYGA
ncbi:MAG: DUF4214 domain-containing protein [Pseudomonadota bacterium]